MDYQNRVGSKKGSGGIAGNAETNQHRRERLRQLMLSKIDIDTDPYVFKNHLGMLECKLCFTSHASEGSYLTHTHGKKHQLNLMKRAELEKRKNKINDNDDLEHTGISHISKKQYVKIGLPSYNVSKIRDPITLQKGLLFKLNFKNLKIGLKKPRFRFMSCFEQNVEIVDSKFQYLIISGEPYENIAFKISSDAIDLNDGKIWDFWDTDTMEYFIQFFYL
ncbi:hypothetical protein CANARDRAFT_8987 [[Candida] arabinofermentans NRRL YB-2248]|uniref:U1-type domain-containing protein n=1 Tax=[Candida] arabinofermentans NRRL YB-2248 TaxID=983967 RepID=A0A1E4SX19_9ASCO|nr:hypothetical protein CANARDRAFT_8987 [[Candida] arabinofermentans NRRL YB-2248]